MRTAFNPATVTRNVVGNAVVLHARDEISPEAQTLALEVRPDPQHDIVVFDLHTGLPAGFWEAVAATLHGTRRDLRLIFLGAGRETSLLAGQFLADRLGRAVLSPDGAVTLSESGMLFAHGGEGSGWIRYRRGRPPEWTGKRHPAPAWDAQVAESLPTSAAGVAEPLPGGVWLHHTGAEAAAYAAWLTTSMACDPDQVTVVIGSPGAPALALDDVARFWRLLGDQARSRARFVQYGDVRLGEGVSFGQALADLLGAPVVCLTGVPTGRPDEALMHTTATDGQPGWQTFAREVRFSPQASAPPQIVAHRATAELGDPLGALQFQYAGDAVVEIVESGLWIRGNDLPGHAAAVRSRALDPDRFEVLVDDADPAQVARLRQLAEDLVSRLDAPTQQRAGFLTASSGAPVGEFVAAVTAPMAEPVAFAAIESPAFDLAPLRPAVVAPVVVAAPAAVVAPAPAAPVSALAEPTMQLPIVAPAPVLEQITEQVRVLPPVARPAVPAAAPAPVVPNGFFQATPDPAARAVAGTEAVAADRVWLGETFTSRYRSARTEVEQVLARYSGFQAEDGLITDLAAVRMYLTGFGIGVSQTLHGGAIGPHLPFARCVASGLTKMPEHHGPAMLSADLNATELEWITTRPVLTDWGFTEALTVPAVLPGTVDVLIWAAGAAATEPLEPVDEHHADHRVIFPPGSRFEVLTTMPQAAETRGRLLLRHLPPGADPDPLGSDVIIAELQRAADRWLTGTARATVGAAAVRRFAQVPGLTAEPGSGLRPRVS
ncbi:hypothetical protein [Actinoplanes awajinensis]|uniref:Uncharacterized protein n=1 Tax=Actinoplanes awajinensis subsp. mycoplanecinus TaxID=135947 RepID=A0A101J9C1_9ACTN|nr:hypothetical protein [Actinoplanes awajinensis]KUL22663.1 hypothetical protein ADL15_47770 [Actinoplanes awajinensis subsp. mycoplanecinus]